MKTVFLFLLIFLLFSSPQLPPIIFSTTNASPVVHDTPKSNTARHLVKSLPGIDSINKLLKPVMHAGHITLHPSNNTNYFYWKFEQKVQNTNTKRATSTSESTRGRSTSSGTGTNNNDRLIIWLNGGPGCSSMDGALMEIGPLRLNANNEVYFNNGTWLELASLIFLDQPVNTGFSYGDIYHTEMTGVAWDFLIFLQKYFELYPQDQGKELYIAGESYAGQYMPYFAKYILDHNKKYQKDQTKQYNLKGILIGNGWISPTYTGLSYLEFAMKNNIITGKEPYLRQVLSQQEKCQNMLHNLNSESSQESKNAVYKACDEILTKLLNVLNEHDESHQCINMYDVRLKDSFPACGMNWPPDISFLNEFLSDPEIQRLLNLNDEYTERAKSGAIHDNNGKLQWHECNTRVGKALTNTNSKSSDELLPEVLSQLPVLLFNGDKDIICNYIGAENFIADLKWNAAETIEEYKDSDEEKNEEKDEEKDDNLHLQKGFSHDLKPIKWYYNDTNVGEVKLERNLTYIKVFNASHMVPFDMPDVSRGIFDLITGNYEMIENRQEDKDNNKDNDKDNNKKDYIIVTPIYNVSSHTYQYIHLASQSSHRFYEDYMQPRYAIYLIVLSVILYGLYYYNSKLLEKDRKMPHSILVSNKQQVERERERERERQQRAHGGSNGDGDGGGGAYSYSIRDGASSPLTIAAAQFLNSAAGRVKGKGKGRGQKLGKKKSVQWADLQQQHEDGIDGHSGYNGADIGMNRANGAPLPGGGTKYSDGLGYSDVDIEQDITTAASTNGRNRNTDRQPETRNPSEHSSKIGSLFNRLNRLNFGGSIGQRDKVKYYKASNFDPEEEIEMVSRYEDVDLNVDHNGNFEIGSNSDNEDDNDVFDRQSENSGDKNKDEDEDDLGFSRTHNNADLK